MSHPAAQEYVRKVIDTSVNAWGFQYLKLDFLYAATIPGRHYDPSLTRAQIYDQAMSVIREAAGKDTYMLGCGAPIGGMIGHVDAMRIGADVASNWKPKYKGVELFFPNEPNVPAVEKALQNTITRGWFHNRWWMNDPDCLLLRSTTQLTEDEVRTQASLTAMTGGLVLLSDDLSQIPHKRMKTPPGNYSGNRENPTNNRLAYTPYTDPFAGGYGWSRRALAFDLIHELV